MSDKNYEQYGEEWKKEMRKFNKTELIILLKQALLKDKEDKEVKP